MASGSSAQMHSQNAHLLGSYEGAIHLVKHPKIFSKTSAKRPPKRPMDSVANASGLPRPFPASMSVGLSRQVYARLANEAVVLKSMRSSRKQYWNRIPDDGRAAGTIGRRSALTAAIGIEVERRAT